MPGPPSPPKGKLPRVGLVASLFGPSKYYRAQGWDLKGYRAPQKGFPSKPHCSPESQTWDTSTVDPLESVPWELAPANRQPISRTGPGTKPQGDRRWGQRPADCPEARAKPQPPGQGARQKRSRSRAPRGPSPRVQQHRPRRQHAREEREGQMPGQSRTARQRGGGWGRLAVFEAAPSCRRGN